MPSLRSSAGRKRAAVGVAALWVALAAVRCADVNRGLGEACIRNEDCLSGVCAGQECVAAPTTFDAAPASTADASTDSAPGDSATDAITPADTGKRADAFTAPEGGIQEGGAIDGALHDSGAEAGDATRDSSADAAADGPHEKDSGSTDGHPASG